MVKVGGSKNYRRISWHLFMKQKAPEKALEGTIQSSNAASNHQKYASTHQFQLHPFKSSSFWRSLHVRRHVRPGPFASRTPRLPHTSKIHGYVPPGPGTYGATTGSSASPRAASPSACFVLPGAGNPAKYCAEPEPGPGSYLGTDVVVPSGALWSVLVLR